LLFNIGALKSVGQDYGDGYDLELLVKYLSKLCDT
jgi:hypothetical protein